jgi:biotin carboxyl carrier protein
MTDRTESRYRVQVRQGSQPLAMTASVHRANPQGTPSKGLISLEAGDGPVREYAVRWERQQSEVRIHRPNGEVCSYHVTCIAPGEYVVQDGYTEARIVLEEMAPSYLQHLAHGSSQRADARVHTVHASMPGRVVDVLVRAGDVVQEGQSLLVMEAMKMQNDVRSSRAGVVRNVYVTPGANLERNAALVEIDCGNTQAT